MKKSPPSGRFLEHLPVIEHTLDPPEVTADPGQWRRIGEEVSETKAGPALRQAIRTSQSRPIHRRLKTLLDRLALRAILPKSTLGKAIGYALSEWSKLQVYLSDERIEIDNNLVENCRRLGIDTREYLEDVLTPLPA